MTVTQVVVELCGAHEVVRVWIDHKLSGELTVGLGDGHRVAKLLKGFSKLDVSKEPHWLYKDFNVLYRTAKQFVAPEPMAAYDPSARLIELQRQLERLAPAFTDTEEVRAAMRGR